MSDRLIEELREATRAQSRLRPVEPARPAGPDGGGGGGGGGRSAFRWPVVLVVVVLVLGGWFVMRRLSADSQMQDCVMSGRRNCAPIDTSAVRPDPPEPSGPASQP